MKKYKLVIKDVKHEQLKAVMEKLQSEFPAMTWIGGDKLTDYDPKMECVNIMVLTKKYVSTVPAFTDKTRVCYCEDTFCEDDAKKIVTADEYLPEKDFPPLSAFPPGTKVRLLDFSGFEPKALTLYDHMKGSIGKTAVVMKDEDPGDHSRKVYVEDIKDWWYWDSRGLELIEDDPDEKVTEKRDRKAELLEYLEENHILPLSRKGLVDWLDEMGYFTAPASTRFHGAYEGGLYDHSIAVTKKLVEMTDKMGLVWEKSRSPYVVGLLHDICKCDAYIKKEDGTYEYNKEQILTGHGDKSAIIACRRWIHLSEEEMLCIRYHMGAYEGESMWENYGAAIGKYPNVLWTHAADMYAAKVLRT